MPNSPKSFLNNPLVTLIVGGGLLLWAARAMGAFGMLRTPFGVLLNETDNGGSITEKVGSVVTVSLNSSPSIGTWRLSPANDPLFNQPTTSSGIKTGVGYDFRQSRSWKLTPGMIGTHRIQLDYQKGNEPPTKSFSVIVNVIG